MNKKHILACIIASSSIASVGGSSAAILLPNSIYQMTLDVNTSSMTFGSLPGANSNVMLDNTSSPSFVNANGGNGVLDGDAGVITFVTDNTGDNLVITSFQVDPIFTGGTASEAYLYQYPDSVIGTTAMSGTIDPVTGAMSLNLTGRRADLSNFTTIGQMEFNRDSTSGIYELFTSDTACNLLGCISGSAVTPSGIPNEFKVTLVSAGELGTAWGGFAGNSYFEVWDSQNTISLIGPVPVPSAVWLFGSGLLCLATAARRKIKH